MTTIRNPAPHSGYSPVGYVPMSGSGQLARRCRRGGQSVATGHMQNGLDCPWHMSRVHPGFLGLVGACLGGASDRADAAKVVTRPSPRCRPRTRPCPRWHDRTRTSGIQVAASLHMRSNGSVLTAYHRGAISSVSTGTPRQGGARGRPWCACPNWGLGREGEQESRRPRAARPDRPAGPTPRPPPVCGGIAFGLAGQQVTAEPDDLAGPEAALLPAEEDLAGARRPHGARSTSTTRRTPGGATVVRSHVGHRAMLSSHGQLSNRHLASRLWNRVTSLGFTER